MRRHRIALVVDHPDRDLAGLVMTAAELCRQGAVCYLVPMNLADRELWALAPDFVLLNYIRATNRDMVRRLAAAGIGFAVLDTEGGVWSTAESYAELLRPVTAELKLASCACVWGPRMAEYLVRERFYSDGQISVTGCPRFDLYSPTWRTVLCDSNGARGERPRILINTNFTTVNSRFASTAENLALHLRLGVPRTAVEAMIAAEREAIVLTIDLARALAEDFPELSIVLRPHPFERADPYLRGLAGLNNLQVNSCGPVQPQILKAAVVIQRSCSTAIEAGLAGVPTLSPQWIPPYTLIPMAEAVSVPCPDYRDLKAHVQAIREGSFAASETIRQALQSTVSDWFCDVDGNAHKRVAAAVLAHIRESNIDRELCRKFLYGMGSDEGLPTSARLGNRIRHGLRLGPDWSFRSLCRVPQSAWCRTTKAFDEQRVGALLARIHSAAVAAGRDGSGSIQAVLARNAGDLMEHVAGYSVRLSA
jgi:surface carbohydrate biosynthesis protein